MLVGVVGVTLFLLLHRRCLGRVNGLLLGSLVFPGAVSTLPVGVEGALDLVSGLLMGLLGAGSLALLWAVAESWECFSVPGFTTSLDTLCAGKVGPRAGSALLAGSAASAAFAGAMLLAAAYGFERARAAIETAAWRIDPESLLEALLADWRQHVGDAPLADDTTLVVLRRELDAD